MVLRLWVVLLLWSGLTHASEPRPISGTHLIPRSTAASAPSTKRQTQTFQVGDPLTVSAFSFQLLGGGHYTTTTKCRFVGTNCYIFVEDVVWGTSRVPESAIEPLANAFDLASAADPSRGIYDITTTLFGPAPDVDGDPRIIIVLLDILDSPFTGTTVIGYFDVDNQSPPASREIVYVDVNPLDIEGTLARATLAHEFQHMLHWHADPDEDKWLDEGCSEYAELACGYKDTTEAVANAFLDVPNTSLTVWEDLPFDFDQAFLYMTYFAQRFGDDAVRSLVGETANGVESVDLVLSELGLADRFNDTFAEWTVALFLDGDGNNGLSRVDVRRPLATTVSLPADNINRKARLWGADYLDLEGNLDALSVSVGSTGDNPLVAILIGQDGGAFIELAAGQTTTVNVYRDDIQSIALTSAGGTGEDYVLTLGAAPDGSSFAASDFTADGFVNFADFLLFAAGFGRTGLDVGFVPSYDLNGNFAVDFTDFLIFVGHFATE